MIHVTMIVLQMYRVHGRGGGIVFYEKKNFAFEYYVNVYKSWYVN